MIELESDRLLVDEDFQLKIPPGMQLSAKMLDERGNSWTSFVSGARPMDWVVEMQPSGTPSLYRKHSLAPAQIKLDLLDGDTLVDQKIVYQEYTKSGVMVETIGHATVYSPKHAIEDSPGVIVLGGSSGGRRDTLASLLASRGYEVMALPYFRFDDLPSELSYIPLEYFHEPISYMKKRRGKVALHGTSKGGELALLLASIYPIDRVVAVVPSCATYGGFPNFTESSWSLEGTGLPVAPIKVPKKVEGVIRPTPFFLAAIEEIEAALLPFERITCPLMVITAGDDQMWPSKEFGKIIKTHIPRTKLLSYEKAGHMITHPYIPTTVSQSYNPVDGRTYELGGTTWDHADACRDSWVEILRFLCY